MFLQTKLSRFLNSIGIELRRYPNRLLRNRKTLLDSFGVDLVVDVGASFGQYAKRLRRIGYKQTIHSYEPIPECFNTLNADFQKDIKWQGFQYALGHENCTKQLKIASNLYSSSFFEFKESHTNAAPSVEMAQVIDVNIKRFDTLYEDTVDSYQGIFVKLDAQGYEYNILQGCGNLLAKIKGFQIELSLENLYEGELNYLTIIQFLEKKGFKLYSLEPGFMNKKTGQLLQFDGVFFRD